jgi:hypothetical protein
MCIRIFAYITIVCPSRLIYIKETGNDKTKIRHLLFLYSSLEYQQDIDISKKNILITRIYILYPSITKNHKNI